MIYVKTVITFIIVTVFSEFANSADYCNISRCNPKNSQTLCKYTSISPRCSQGGGNLGRGLTAAERKEIVSRHNYLRRLVASGSEKRGRPGPQYAAKSMPDLVWDNELATVAQRWADQCTGGHDSCRNVERFSVGQNAGQIGTTGNNSTIRYSSIVNNWYNEVAKYNRDAVSSFNGVGSGGNVVGHYTQLVWAKTRTIGCGAQKYYNNGFKTVQLICNYGPSGNWRGEPVYEKR